MPADKNKSMASFVALSGLAQELNAPLQSLVKSSQKLLNDYQSRDFEYISYKDFKTIMTTLEQMNQQLKRCALTTDRMIRLKAEGASPEASNINDVVNEVLDILGTQLKTARVSVNLRLGAQLPPVAMNKVDCHQVIYNILINSIQAMPASGRIKIRTGLDASRKMITIDIDDEGVGIAPEHLTKIFEPFFTTKERGVEKSSGLGLSIVYSLVHAAGGDVHIQSSLRKGTMVHVDLPVYQPVVS